MICEVEITEEAASEEKEDAKAEDVEEEQEPEEALDSQQDRDGKNKSSVLYTYVVVISEQWWFVFPSQVSVRWNLTSSC